MRTYFSLVLFFFTNLIITAQEIQFDAFTNWIPQFNNYGELMNGQSKNDQLNISVRVYNVINPIEKWKITVRLADDYRYNGYSIPTEFGLLKFVRENQQGAQSYTPIQAQAGFYRYLNIKSKQLLVVKRFLYRTVLLEILYLTFKLEAEIIYLQFRMVNTKPITFSIYIK